MALEFKNQIHTIVRPELQLLGYELHDSDGDVVAFQKVETDTLYKIEFQELVWSKKLPDTFKVWLWRIPVPFNLEKTYAIEPLGATLTEIMQTVYNKKASYVNERHGEFIEDNDFSKQLAECLDFLKGYGIPWLEDPQSTMAFEKKENLD
jgi:hypothetical protein